MFSLPLFHIIGPRDRSSGICRPVVLLWLLTATIYPLPSYALTKCVQSDGAITFTDKGCASTGQGNAEQIVSKSQQVNKADAYFRAHGFAGEQDFQDRKKLCSQMLSRAREAPRTSFCGEQTSCINRVTKAYVEKNIQDLKRKNVWRDNRCETVFRLTNTRS